MESLGQWGKGPVSGGDSFTAPRAFFPKADFLSRAAITNLVDETRRAILGDLRGVPKCSSAELSLINDLMAHYENGEPRHANSRDPKREPHIQGGGDSEEYGTSRLRSKKAKGFLSSGSGDA